MSTYLGIDLGTSGVKTLLIDNQQTILKTATASFDVNRPSPGWSEQDPAQWIRATGETLKALKQSHPNEMAAARGIGLSGQMHGATLLGDDDSILRPCILWNDSRSHVEAAELDTDRIRQISGNIVFPGFTAPKLSWVRKNEPEVFNHTAKVLLPKDYLRLWLTGEYVSEMSDAAGTAWLDVAARQWSDELLEAGQMRADQMPRLVEGTAVSGTLRPALAAEFGLSKAVVVAGGAGDNAASACGMGTVSAGTAFASLGTSGVLFAANDAYRPNPASAVHTFCHALPDTWHQMGVILSATDSLNWWAGITGQSAAALTDNLGEELQPPGSATFLPYLGGERTPHNNASARALIAGIGHESDAIGVTQAILEGVSFAFRDNLAALESAGTKLSRVTAIGGGSRSTYWVNLLATVLNMPIDTAVEGDFGAGFGAARLGMIAAQNSDPATACVAPEVARTYEPNHALVAAFAERYARYRELYVVS